MFDINEIKKDLYKSKNMAYFSHYQSGDLFYNVVVMDALYQFPIAVVETDYIEPFEEGEDEREIIKLSEDLGSTPFEAEMKGSELIRWMQMAIKKEQFIKVG
jgi:hypothetical protein